MPGKNQTTVTLKEEHMQMLEKKAQSLKLKPSTYLAILIQKNCAEA